MVAIENPTALMAEKEFPNIERFARMPLLTVPTAIQRLSRLCQAIGPALCGVNLYVKRDDVAHIGGGGNKLRKLEFLIGEALAQGADTFVTVGGLQSNHARLTAAASARAGMACELVLSRQVPRDDVDYECNGNILLDGLFGARVHALPGSVNPLTFAESSRGRASGRRTPRLSRRAGRFFANRLSWLCGLCARGRRAIPGNEYRLSRRDHCKRQLRHTRRAGSGLCRDGFIAAIDPILYRFGAG